MAAAVRSGVRLHHIADKLFLHWWQAGTGPLTLAALILDFSRAGSQRKHSGWDPSHTTSHQTRNDQVMEA